MNIARRGKGMSKEDGNENAEKLRQWDVDR
jgi:hypothetical protein